jgi:NADH-quinone oxidoreductase subunit J
MSPEILLFALLAIVAVVSALAMLFAKNSVYSAIFLILNFSTIAVFYLLLHAPFIALAQITVYAGAIMVLFLFVIMLLGAEETPGEIRLPWQQPLALVLGFILVAQIGYLFFTRGAAIGPAGVPPEGFGGPEQIGIILFTDFLLPFEITGILLLVAMVGAIVITQKERLARRKVILGREVAGGEDVISSGRNGGAGVFEEPTRAPSTADDRLQQTPNLDRPTHRR